MDVLVLVLVQLNLVGHVQLEATQNLILRTNT